MRREPVPAGRADADREHAVSGALFAFNFYYVPEANVKQDELRDEIKGKPKQTYLRPDRTWIMGNDSRIFYYHYLRPGRKGDGRRQYFRARPDDVPPEAADLRRARAVAAGPEHVDFRERLDAATSTAQPRRTFAAFPGHHVSGTDGNAGLISLKEAVQETQMNFIELETYIAGPAAERLGYAASCRCSFYRKFSIPLFALIMAMIAMPFGFLVGIAGR